VTVVGDRRGLTRRRVLVGGAALAGTAAVATAGAVATGAVSPRHVLDRLTGACGASGARAPRSEWQVVTGTLTTSRVGFEPRWSVAFPPGHTGATPLPFVLCLHGRGSDHTFTTEALRLQDYVAQAVTERGAGTFAVASVDGHDLYWHPRASGDDPLGMVLDELLPFFEDELSLGAAGRRVGVMGWSMGGYGALLAAQTDPERFAAVVAASPAIVRTYDDATRDAFDNAADFADHDVFAHADRLAGVPVRIDCGGADPYRDEAEAFADLLSRAPETDFTDGCHDQDYWRRVAPADVDFLAAHLHTPPGQSRPGHDR
jgi:enterochelin esterase-like enzyme